MEVSQQSTKIALRTLAFAMLTCVSQFSSGGLIYDEAVSGDLSDLFLAPTLLSVTPGSNEVKMTLDQLNQDVFTFTVAPGHQLAAITLTDFEILTPISFGNMVVLGIDNGNVMGTSPLDWLALASIGGSGSTIGDNLIGHLPSSFFGPGDYSFLAGDAAEGSARLALDFQIVPAPSTLSLLLISAICFLSNHKRGRVH